MSVWFTFFFDTGHLDSLALVLFLIYEFSWVGFDSKSGIMSITTTVSLHIERPSFLWTVFRIWPRPKILIKWFIDSPNSFPLSPRVDQVSPSGESLTTLSITSDVHNVLSMTPLKRIRRVKIISPSTRSLSCNLDHHFPGGTTTRIVTRS